MIKHMFGLLALVLMMGMLSACSGSGGDKQITIGGKSFTEQYMLTEMTALLLEEQGFEVDKKLNMGSSIARKALTNGQIDMMWEYTGTGLVSYLGEDPIFDPDKAFQTVKKLDKKRNDIIWVNMSQVNNTYCLLMRKEQAKKLGIQSLGDLAKYVKNHPGELKLAADGEFTNRPDGLPGLEKAYNFEFGSGQVVKMKTGLTYKALKQGQVDVAMGFSTDPRIKAYNLLVLDDNKQFFPPYYAAVEMREDVFKKYPKIQEITEPLANKLTSRIMINLTYQVDIKGKKVRKVAKNWLVEQGLLEK
ncbi:MAG TPA: glycine betaine ABC transporter substrate-binding protein [Bacillales bacterium]